MNFLEVLEKIEQNSNKSVNKYTPQWVADRVDDIQAELNHYEKHFEGKTILCNCDDPFESNFCKFFLKNFNYFKLKRLIRTSYYRVLQTRENANTNPTKV